MAHEEFLSGYKGGVLVQVSESMQIVCGGLAPEVALADVDEAKLAQAVYCAAKIQKHGTFRGKKLGVISSRAGSFMCPGSVILFEVDENNTATVDFPWSSQYTDSRKCGTVVSNVMINVPLGLIHPLKNSTEQTD